MPSKHTYSFMGNALRDVAGGLMAHQKITALQAREENFARFRQEQFDYRKEQDVLNRADRTDAYGAPLAGLNADGQLSYSQFNSAGDRRELDGFAPVAKQSPPTKLARLISERNALPGGDQLISRYDAAIAKETSGKNGITIDPDGTIHVGGSASGELTKPTITKQQAKLINTTFSLIRMGEIKKHYNPEFLTYQGKAGNALRVLKDKSGIELSSEEKGQLKQRRKFTQSVNHEFNAYRKEITGAAAAVKELEDLKKAMISEDLSPTQFEAAYELYMGELSRSMRIRNKLLREGLTTDPGQFGSKLDDMFLSRQDDDPRTRYRELIDSGKTPEEAGSILELEGYDQPETTNQPRQEAPQQALDYLRASPHYSEQFRAKYGYLPEA